MNILFHQLLLLFRVLCVFRGEILTSVNQCSSVGKTSSVFSVV